MATTTEIAPNIYRISIYAQWGDLQFNHFLVKPPPNPECPWGFLPRFPRVPRFPGFALPATCSCDSAFLFVSGFPAQNLGRVIHHRHRRPAAGEKKATRKRQVPHSQAVAASGKDSLDGMARRVLAPSTSITNGRSGRRRQLNPTGGKSDQGR